MTVTAPISGSITALAVAVGQFVNDPTAMAMTCRISTTSGSRRTCRRDEIAGVVKGLKADVTLAAYPDETLHGTVQFVDAILAPDTRRERVRIAFANPRR